MSEQLQSDFDKIVKNSKFSNREIEFKKDFLSLTNKIFSKLVEKHKYIPLEIEIATFTSWK